VELSDVCGAYITRIVGMLFFFLFYGTAGLDDDDELVLLITPT